MRSKRWDEEFRELKFRVVATVNRRISQQISSIVAEEKRTDNEATASSVIEALLKRGLLFWYAEHGSLARCPE